MLLSLDDACLFFRLHGTLMKFVNEKLNIIDGFPTALNFADLSFADRRKVIQAFLDRTDIIDEFVARNPAAFAHDELQIVSSWRHRVAGKFIVLRQLKKHMIFLSNDGTGVIIAIAGSMMCF